MRFLIFAKTTYTHRERETTANDFQANFHNEMRREKNGWKNKKTKTEAICLAAIYMDLKLVKLKIGVETMKIISTTSKLANWHLANDLYRKRFGIKCYSFVYHTSCIFARLSFAFHRMECDIFGTAYGTICMSP